MLCLVPAGVRPAKMLSTDLRLLFSPQPLGFRVNTYCIEPLSHKPSSQPVLPSPLQDWLKPQPTPGNPPHTQHSIQGTKHAGDGTAAFYPLQ